MSGAIAVGGNAMGTTAAVREKRRSPRVAFECPLRYRVVPVREAGYRSACVRDISLTGFRFRSQELLPRQAGFILEMNPSGFEMIRSLARTTWVRAMPEGSGYEIGGTFVEPNSATRTTLAQLLSRPREAAEKPVFR